MKRILFLLLLFAVISSTSAINLSVEKVGGKDVMINGLNEPATFDIRIKNLGGTDYFQFYNLLGFSMAPKGTVLISSGETKDVQLIFYPREDFENNGYYTLQYFIQGEQGDKISESVTVNMVDLGEIFEVGSGEVSPETNSLDIYINNKVNFEFKDLNVGFSSPFFELEKTISLNPYEKKTFSVQVNKDDFQKLTAGFYTLTANVEYKGKKTGVEGIINFIEQNLIKTTENDYGIFLNTRMIEKKNQGNTVADSDVNIKKNVISRLFTTFSPEPDSTRRQGLMVYYTWNQKINPGESLKVTVRTNWFFPLLVIFFIVAIVIIIKQYAKRNLVLKKKINFVHSKGGEFALRVTIFVKAKAYVERVNVIDRVPPLVKIYDKFGGITPTRFDEKTRRIEWNINSLLPGERRTLSYVVYSKVGIMGKFALPEATAIFEKDGEVHETESNRAFFVAEQKGNGDN